MLKWEAWTRLVLNLGCILVSPGNLKKILIAKPQVRQTRMGWDDVEGSISSFKIMFCFPLGTVCPSSQASLYREAWWAMVYGATQSQAWPSIWVSMSLITELTFLLGSSSQRPAPPQVHLRAHISSCFPGIFHHIWLPFQSNKLSSVFFSTFTTCNWFLDGIL